MSINQTSDRNRASDEGDVDELDLAGDDTDLDLGDLPETKVETKEPKEAKEVKEPDKKDFKKLSTREAIKDAWKEQEKKEESPADKTAKPSDKALKEVLDTAKDTAQKKEPSTTTAAPVSWSKEAKAQWNTLPPDIQAAINKREKEASDGFKDYGEKTKRLKELETVLAPRQEAIRNFGVSEAQTVDRLFQWMEALANPNKQYAAQQLMLLGKNFGITLPANNAATQQQQEGGVEIPEPLRNFMENINTKVETLEQQRQREAYDRQQSEQQGAKDYLNNWAKDKPHYEKVKTVMYGLLNSGAIPLKDGALDLDSAYNQAVYANPEVRELVMQEEANQKAAKEEQKRKDAELVRLKKLNAAKKASTLSNRAPSGNAGQQKQQTRAQSVRESIAAARREVMENS